MKYRRKPVDIEAVQFTRDSIEECKGLVATCRTGVTLKDITIPRCLDGVMTGSIVQTDTGQWIYDIEENDFVVRDSAGEFFSRKHDIFKHLYEKVKE